MSASLGAALHPARTTKQDPDDRVFTEKGVAADLLDFMEEFQKARPHLADRDFYVTGESYAVSPEWPALCTLMGFEQASPRLSDRFLVDRQHTHVLLRPCP